MKRGPNVLEAVVINRHSGHGFKKRFLANKYTTFITLEMWERITAFKCLPGVSERSCSLAAPPGLSPQPASEAEAPEGACPMEAVGPPSPACAQQLMMNLPDE